MFINEAYDYITEATRNLPQWIKVIYWAISYEYNSPKTDDAGNLQPSHIGNYFSTIRFNDYDLTKKDAEVTMYYTGNIKSTLLHGSTTITDVRPFTIEYRFDGKDEIQSMIKYDYETKLQRALETGNPGVADAETLHEIAREFVRYAKIYWKNDENDAVTFTRSQLRNFGEELVNCKLLAGSKIKRDGAKREKRPQSYSASTFYTFTVPADKMPEFNKIYAAANKSGKIQYGEKENEFGKTEPVYYSWPGNFDHQYRKLANGDIKHAFMSMSIFAFKFANLINDLGLTTDGIKANAIDKPGQAKDMLNQKDKSNATRSTSPRPQAEKTTEITIAFDTESFERGSNLCKIFVKKYQLSHPKNNTEIDIDDNAQSITITGMSSNEIKNMTDFFNKKNIEYTEM